MKKLGLVFVIICILLAGLQFFYTRPSTYQIAGNFSSGDSYGVKCLASDPICGVCVDGRKYGEIIDGKCYIEGTVYGFPLKAPKQTNALLFVNALIITTLGITVFAILARIKRS